MPVYVLARGQKPAEVTGCTDSHETRYDREARGSEFIQGM